MMTSAALLFAILAPLVAGVFAALFMLARRLDNYGIVDVAWSLGFAPLATAYGIFLDGAPERRALITAMAVLWSIRLGAHLWERVVGNLSVEDGRYAALRRHWGARLGTRMAAFYQIQGVLLLLLSLPFALACANPAPELHPIELAAAALWTAALIGEARADAQLASFKRDPANRGRVCATGLWRLSRHPNYFFEWLVWVAFALFALASPWGWLALSCPAFMLYLLLRVTGIPQTEAQLLRSKGAAYEAYRRSTSAFFPLPPRPSPIQSDSPHAS